MQSASPDLSPTPELRIKKCFKYCSTCAGRAHVAIYLPFQFSVLTANKISQNKLGLARCGSTHSHNLTNLIWPKYHFPKICTIRF